MIAVIHFFEITLSPKTKKKFPSLILNYHRRNIITDKYERTISNY